MFRRKQARSVIAAPVRAAAHAWVDQLESRTLLAGDPTVVRPLPYSLDFNSDRGGLSDVDGEGTGFTWVQPNAAGNEYQPGLIDLHTSLGFLTLTGAGSATSGTNFESDNTLVNALQAQFDATVGGGFSITARLLGPLNALGNDGEQAGVMFGPDADNFIKLVIGSSGGEHFVQFLDEQNQTTHVLDNAGQGITKSPGRFSDIDTLDLTISGDASAGVIRAFYTINGGAQNPLGFLTLGGAEASAFFNNKGRAGVFVQHHNDSPAPSIAFDNFAVTQGAMVAHPSITGTRPDDGKTNLRRDGYVGADLRLPTPGAGIDEATLNNNTVTLTRIRDGKRINAVVNTSAGGDSIALTPSGLLDENTRYTFSVNSGLKDLSGASFTPFNTTFTTGTLGAAADPSIAFNKVMLPSAQGQVFASVKIGPDGKLYATTLTGYIFRWTIKKDGTLKDRQTIATVRLNNGNGPRFVTGLTFDPSSTASKLIAYVSHGAYAFENAPDWSGKLSMLSGPDLASYKDLVVGLPRSVRDHLTNQSVFGPDGKLYLAQSSESAMGAPDSAWGLRSEHLLNAAILQVDVKALVQRRADHKPPLNVMTDDGGTYDPFASNAPVKLYATGVRNAYDLVWHSNGQLYAPANGSASGGHTPGWTGTWTSNRIDTAARGPYPIDVPSLTTAPTQDDFLYRLQQGGYYGHPNPTRGEFVLNGGNPTSGADNNEVTQYPAGTMPDRNYRGDAFDFGPNLSPDGIIEYRGKQFGGKLDHRLLVCRYSGGDDVVALDVGKDGSVGNQRGGIAGLSHFVDPLDITEDTRNGNLYIVEYGADRITLAQPLSVGTARVSVTPTVRVFNDVRGGARSSPKRITIKNVGSGPLALPSDGVSITGPDGSLFDIVSQPTLPTTIPAGSSMTISVAFDPPGSTSPGVKGAVLRIKTNDPKHPIRKIALRGLATTGAGGNNEPSLQHILDLWQIPITVGDNNPNDTEFPVTAVKPNDETTAQRFVKAGSGPVTIQPLGVFVNIADPAIKFGYYTPGTTGDQHELFQVPQAGSQSADVSPNGSTSFDPGSGMFGLFTVFPKLTNPDGSRREAYSEDALNTWDTVHQRKMRAYPLRDVAGKVVKNAYVVSFEDFNQAYDNNDFVAIIRNVAIPKNTKPLIGVQNLDVQGGTPLFPDRLVMSRIQTPNPSSGNAVHNVAHVRIWNTGGKTMSISKLSIDNGSAFKIVGKRKLPLKIPAGRSRDVTVQFVATGGGMSTGNLGITSNAANASTRLVQLAGYWQSNSENDASGKSVEPPLQTIGQLFGFATSFVGAGQSVNQGGRVAAVGDEVLSPYWSRADVSLPVRVTQLAAYHQMPNTATVNWFSQGSNTLNKIFTSLGLDGQTVLPRMSSSGALAQGRFTPSSSVFGFNVDKNEWSDDTKNKQEKSGGGFGHHFRFFPGRDRSGSYLPNTWVMTMDYRAINFDYQDNVYLINNIRPASSIAPPEGAVAFSTGRSITVDWGDTNGATGFNVYRSRFPAKKFAKVNASRLTASIFSDTSVAAGTTYYYRIAAIGSDGHEITPVTAVATA